MGGIIAVIFLGVCAGMAAAGVPTMALIFGLMVVFRLGIRGTWAEYAHLGAPRDACDAWDCWALARTVRLKAHGADFASSISIFSAGPPRMSFFTSKKPRVRLARWSLYLSTGLAFGAVLIPLFLGACVFSAPGYNGPVSDHFDGERFHNLEPFGEKSFGDVMKWRWTSSKTPWPDKRGLPPGPPPPRRVEGEELRVTFVNHATVLIQTAGLNILTDPVWSERTSPVSWAGPKRQKDAGILYEDLPPIDLVVISHNHYDHLDIATLKKLSADHAPLILVPLGNAALLQANGIANARDLDWWESVDVAPGVRATFTRCQHWSSRGTRDRFKTLWGGFAFETPGGLVYYSGDTGFGTFYNEVRERFGRPRLALLPIGAYEPRWFMKSAHQNPEEAVQAHNVLQPLVSLGVHWGTWQLTDEGMDAPVVALDAALENAGLTPEDFWVLDNGQGRDVPAMP